MNEKAHVPLNVRQLQKRGREREISVSGEMLTRRQKLLTLYHAERDKTIHLLHCGNSIAFQSHSLANVSDGRAYGVSFLFLKFFLACLLYMSPNEKSRCLTSQLIIYKHAHSSNLFLAGKMPMSILPAIFVISHRPLRENNSFAWFFVPLILKGLDTLFLTPRFFY